MKTFQEKLKNHLNFVKPLYRNVKSNRVEPNCMCVSITVDRTLKLDGNDIHVKGKTVNNKGVAYNSVSVKHKNNVSEQYNSYLRNACESNINRNKNDNKNINAGPLVSKCVNVRSERKKRSFRNFNMLIDTGKDHKVSQNSEKTQKKVEDKNRTIIVHRVPDTWLRVYPAPATPTESLCTVIFRCIVCQLGLAAILVLWTALWLLVLYCIEGPHEIKVSTDFQKEQNQLVIDLATELRQITPLSPKWRKAIEARIEEERQLTIMAVGKGARLHPGHFWDLPGTFLFTIYVMTALGFGAPVPQTLWGRTSTLVYAAVAIPAHIYIMVNASTCLVVHMENFVKRMKKYFNERLHFVVGRTDVENNRESPSCSRNSELIKSSNRSNLRRKIIRCLGMVCVCRCIPLAAVLYYILGMLCFGVLRSKLPLETIMFPLEFTTSGGLEHVAGHVRITYAFYIEGAMYLLACSLATLRRHSAPAVSTMSRKYRLFTSEALKHSDVSDTT